jgi:hypothetical protein
MKNKRKEKKTNYQHLTEDHRSKMTPFFKEDTWKVGNKKGCAMMKKDDETR